MLKHYLTAAIRRIRLHKVTTAANVACLVLGLTCFIVAWGATAYFGEADGYRANAPRLHFIITSDASDKSEPLLPIGPALLADRLAAAFPQMEAVARATPPREIPVAVDDGSLFAKVVYVDPKFLTIFELPLTDSATSDSEALLSSPGTAIVSRAMATRLFGTDQVVGRSFRLGGGKDSLQNVTITGVVGPIRQPSQLTTDTASRARPYQLQFDLLMSMDMNAALSTTQEWNTRAYFTFVSLPRDGSLTANELNDQLDTFAERHVPSEGAAGQQRFRAYPIASVTQITFDALMGTSWTGISSTAVLMMLGGLVLLVACFNYANLATAQYVARAREISVRRVLGAERFHVIAQHLTEGLLLTCTAVLASLLCIAAPLAVVGRLSAVASMFLAMPQLWLFLATVVVVVTLLACAYPAIVLSRVRPMDAQRGMRARGSRVVPNLLVGLQFAFSAFLLVATFVIVAQNAAMSRAIASPESDPIVVIANDLRDAGVDPRVFKTELSSRAGISAVGGTQFVPFTGFRFAGLSETPDASGARLRAAEQIVDPEVFAALGIRLLAGRTFEMQRAEDTANIRAWRESDVAAATDYNAVIELALARRLGFEAPEQAVGAIIYRPTSDLGSTPPQRLHVIGVVENTVIVPLSLGAKNFYLMNAEAAAAPVIRVAKTDVAAGLESIDDVWSRLAADVPLRRRFADEQYEAAYGALNVVDDVFAALGTLASLIAVTGLIGMALHTMRRRAKEIAVRRVTGASVRQILSMLLLSFLRPIVIANVAVWPFVHVVMSGYLSLFAVRSGLSPTPFIASLAIALGVAAAAVVAQATRAARIPPATSLRSE